MRNDIYEMNILLDKDLEQVVGGINCEKEKCYQVRGLAKNGRLVVAYFDDYFDAVKFCYRLGVDPSCIKIVDSPFK